jgi:hypothetical protein
MVKLLVITGLLLGAAPVVAQTQPSAPAISFDDQPAAATKEDSKRLICRSEEKIGSRLASKRVCMTAAQWKDREQQTRRDLDQLHTNTQPAGGPG